MADNSASNGTSNSYDFWKDKIDERDENNSSDSDDNGALFQPLRDAYTDVAGWILATDEYQGPVADALNPFIDPFRNTALGALQYLYQDVHNLELTYQLAQPFIKAADQALDYVVTQVQKLQDDMASSNPPGDSTPAGNSSPSTEQNALPSITASA